MKKVFDELGRILMDFVETFIMALAIFIVVYMFLLQPHHVQGQSMMPTFEDNDYILTDKITYRFKKPSRGDVVVFRSPQNPKTDYIKRIIAIPGEKVKVEDGRYFVYNNDHTNGVIISEPYLPESVLTKPGSMAKEGEFYTVPDNQYFVSGDNRNHSSDSRDWGAVPRDNIVGKALLRYWPFNGFGIVKAVDYQL